MFCLCFTAASQPGSDDEDDESDEEDYEPTEIPEDDWKKVSQKVKVS